MPDPSSRPRPALSTLLEGDPELDAALAPKRDRGVLTQLGGLETGRVCSFQPSDVTLGRSAECTHRFDDASLSRVHARIFRDGADFVLEDLGSSNGSFVDGEKIVRKSLRDGDRVRLGLTLTLRFQVVDAKEEADLKSVYDSSVRDGLTSAFNRKHLDECLTAETSFAARHATPLAIVLFDLDHFKRVNDTHGRAAGDEVLRTVASRVRAALRSEDILARYGGEEFVIVARGIALENAKRLGERVRVAVEKSPVPFERAAIQCSISAGVASLACCGADPSPARLLAIADERLYAAKQGGRNRVVSG